MGAPRPAGHLRADRREPSRQIRENVAALEHLDFTTEELSEIDRFAKEGGVDRWERPSHDERP